jgi:hypothetical protein
MEPPPSEPNAAAASRRTADVPWISGGAERQRLGERPDAQLRHHGLAKNHRARRAKPAHHLGVFIFRRAVRVGAHRSDLAGDVDIVLDRDGHTEQRQPLARVQPALRGRRLRTRRTLQHYPVCAQDRVQSVDPVQVCLEQRRRGDRALAQ